VSLLNFKDMQLVLFSTEFTATMFQMLITTLFYLLHSVFMNVFESEF